jgi:diguanylate cyclase (GGDEF)-like protein
LVAASLASPKVALQMTETDQLSKIPHGIDGEAWLQLKKLDVLYGYANLSVLINLLGAVTAAAFLRSVVSQASLTFWFVFGLTLAGARIASRHGYDTQRQIRGERIDYQRWRSIYVIITILAGLHWGLMAALIYPADSLTHQLFVTFIVMGVAAACVPVYSTGTLSFAGFVLPALLPLAARFFYHGEEPYLAMGVMIILFAAVLLVAGAETGRIIRSNMALSHALHHQATHDSLVGLVNHGEFQRRLQTVAGLANARSQQYALIFIDLDLFKRVNDAGGHSVGDRFLVEIGNILRQKVRKADTAARVGGDEFAVILDDCGPEEAQRVASSILRAITGFVLQYDERTFQVGASIGVTYSDKGANSASQMLRAADQACYTAKEAGRNRIEMVKASAGMDSTGRFELLRDLAGITDRIRPAID